MTIDERDLERLGRADLDLEELPTVPPIDADQADELGPQPPRRRGCPPGGRKPGRQAVQPPARVATLKERMAAITAAKAQGPVVGPEPSMSPAPGKPSPGVEKPEEPVENMSPEQPDEPAQESTVDSTEPKRIYQAEAAAILGLTSERVGQLKDKGTLKSGELRQALNPRGGQAWTYLDTEVRELARERAKAPERYAQTSRDRAAAREQKAKERAAAEPVQRDTKPEKAPKAPRQAPDRAAQPAEVPVKARPRTAPPSPRAAAQEPKARAADQLFPPAEPFPSPASALWHLQTLANAGIISRAKLDRVLAVLLEG